MYAIIFSIYNLHERDAAWDSHIDSVVFARLFLFSRSSSMCTLRELASWHSGGTPVQMECA